MLLMTRKGGHLLWKMFNLDYNQGHRGPAWAQGCFTNRKHPFWLLLFKSFLRIFTRMCKTFYMNQGYVGISLR